MDAPKRLKILGKYWMVQHVWTVEGHYGECDIDKCRIKLRMTQHPQQQKDTLLHEVLHALSDSLDLNLSEKQVHQLATTLYGVMHDNKHFIKWLMEKTNERDFYTTES